MTRDTEAQINLPDGTEITLKGSKTSVTEIVAAVAGTRRKDGSAADGGTRAGSSSTPVGTLGGVAEKDNGNVHIIATDLKAKNAMDAARRLVYVTLYARSVLLSEKKTARKALVEVLKGYNLYDGNTRRLIASDKGLIRDGRKTIWLSNPAAEVARGFVKEIQDPTTKGSWGISSRRRRRSGVRARGGAPKNG